MSMASYIIIAAVGVAVIIFIGFLAHRKRVSDAMKNASTVPCKVDDDCSTMPCQNTAVTVPPKLCPTTCNTLVHLCNKPAAS